LDVTGRVIADQREPLIETDESPFGPSRVGLTVGLLLTVSFVAFETLAVATVLPAVAADLGGINLYGWAFSAFLLTQLVGIVISGLLADERGPALPFGLGIVLFSAGLLVGGFAPSMPALIAGRALQGLGGGAISSIAYVAIGRGYPEQSKPRMLALLSTAWVVPGLIGPGIAGLMAEGLGWRSVFLVLAPLPGLAALLAFPSLRRMPDGVPSPQARARVVNAIVLAVGSGLVLAGIGLAQPVIVLGLTVPGLALAIPAMRRLLPAGTLRAAPGMPATVATMGLLNLAFFGVDAFVPLALVDVRGTSVAYAGLALTAATITWTAGAWVQARTATRVSRRSMTWLGLAILAASFVITATVLFPQTPLPAALFGWGMAGLGMGLAYTTLGLTMLELAEPGQEGDASASLQLASVLGSGLGAGIGGALIGLMQTQGETLTRALLLQDGLMLLVVAMGFAVTRGLPGGLPVVASDP
jgi:MFS family permease